MQNVMINKKKLIVASMIMAIIMLAIMPLTAGEDGSGSVIGGVGIAILAATVMAYLGHLLKQPLLLAYLAAGIVIGPSIGLGLIKKPADIETISHFGLILLLFLIGLEIDIKKLKESGKSLIISGLTQFPISFIIGIGFFMILGYSAIDGTYDMLYLAACCGLSSTAIVVKLLYGKFELDTLAGRLTLGILVFQDIWAIFLLGIQPNLANPDVLTILISFGKGFILVAISMLISKYILPRIFKSVAKVPELVLISSLGWCFLICGAAHYLKLSIEMGALIAGVAISTFPYNLDVIAKVVNIRDFFVTLFFVSLGMQIPNPFADISILVTAAAVSVFLIISRFLAIFPALYALRNGLRVSLLTPINLSQISEFSLVIAALGVTAGHISRDTMSIIIFVFVITSIASTYMIKYNDALQKGAASFLKKIGLKEIETAEKGEESAPGKEIAILGFFRTASSLLTEIIDSSTGDGDKSLKDKILVVDFNPEIHESLQSMGVKVVYGDISHPDTLHHAGIHDAKIVVSTIPDTILVGTDNLRIIRHIKEISPHAKIIVTAESIERALKMYAEGADYVFIPRILSAKNIIQMMSLMLSEKQKEIQEIMVREMESLQARNEVIR